MTTRPLLFAALLSLAPACATTEGGPARHGTSLLKNCLDRAGWYGPYREACRQESIEYCRSHNLNDACAINELWTARRGKRVRL